MGPRLAVQLDLPEALRALPVPPLLLQPLVENSIKHGLEPKVAGGRIDVSASTEAGFLLLCVRDTGLGLRPDAAAAADANANADTAGCHFGLAQVRDRLATLYGSRASLVIENTGDAEGGARVTLRLPLTAAGQPQTLFTPNPATP